MFNTRKIKSFSLLITIMLLTLFSFLSISIMETKSISLSIDKLKYLHLQAMIHKQYIIKYISTHSEEEISDFHLSDNRFNLKIIPYTFNDKSFFHIIIQSTNNNLIRIYFKTNK